MSTANLQQRLQDLQREGAQEHVARATDNGQGHDRRVAS